MNTTIIPEAFADFPRRMTEGNIGVHWHIFNPIFLNHAGLQLRHEMHGGVLPSILPQAEYEVLLHPHLQADNIPAAPEVFDPAADDATVWKAMRTAYTLYTQALGQLQHVWDSFIHEYLMEALKHPVLGLSNVSLATQYLHVRNTFGVLPADYLERFFAELNRPQQDVPFLSVIHRIALYGGMCVTAHAPLHDLNKIQLLKTCFAFAPYDDAITRYTREHPHIPRAAGQAAVPGDQSYAGLLAVLTRESQLLQVTVLPPQHSLEAFRHGASALAATTG
jgi:hypothetical protein